MWDVIAHSPILPIPLAAAESKKFIYMEETRMIGLDVNVSYMSSLFSPRARITSVSSQSLRSKRRPDERATTAG
jgi:hypothetical protein